MTDRPAIRAALPADAPALDALYAAAFPQEDLRPLVQALSALGVLSLVGLLGGTVAGHVAFTRCDLEGAPGAAALLGPLAVAPGLQRQGIGRALVMAGLGRLRETSVRLVLVLGDPAYYGRFGFAPEAGVLPPYPIPPEWQPAWQSLGLRAADAPPAGVLRVPAPWQRPALWSA